MFLVISSCPAAGFDRNSAGAAQEASIQKQRASVKGQEAAASSMRRSVLATPLPVPASDTACERAPVLRVLEIVDEGAKRSGLDAELVQAVVRKESGYDTCATSAKGAQGLMQLTPSVQMQFAVIDPYDPKQNIAAGTRFLKQLVDQYGGDLRLALGAYNAGPSSIAHWGGIPPFPETNNYITSILSKLDKKRAYGAEPSDWRIDVRQRRFR